MAGPGAGPGEGRGLVKVGGPQLWGLLPGGVQSTRDGRESDRRSPTALDPRSRDGPEVETDSGELGRLRAELAGALAEMETMKAVAEVSESTKAEAVAAVQRQCQEEVASLQAILKGERTWWAHRDSAPHGWRRRGSGKPDL